MLLILIYLFILLVIPIDHLEWRENERFPIRFQPKSAPIFEESVEICGLHVHVTAFSVIRGIIFKV